MTRNKRRENNDPVWEYIDCRFCNGKGFIGGFKCRDCGGYGYTRKQKK